MSSSLAEGDGPLREPAREPSAESLFARWLVRREDGDEADFEELCRSHAEHVDELRRLCGQYLEFEELRRRFGLSGTLSGRLDSRFGSGIDPKVELEGEEAGASDADFTEQVLGRLSGRAGASTRYRLKGQVAEGGMGAILRVWDEDLRRHLAMKVTLGRREAPSDATPPVDRRTLARFLEEAQVTGQLDHPGIVPVHELGLDAKGRAYFTMKLVKGRDLKAVFDLVREGKEGWSQVRALGVLSKVCEAMSYAHDKGVIHRDLKPANVMVGRYGEVYVMDWGLARILGRPDTRDIRLRPESTGSGPTVIRSDRREHASDTPDSPLYTMDGDVVGTPAYMPPEQANGDLDAMGPASDVFAVGAMLYHLLAGHMPYVRLGEKASNYMVLRWVKDGPPTSLTREAPGAPAELIAIADRAMARDPDDRYPDMPALARDLSAYVEGRVVAAYETGAWAEGKKWVRRNRALAAALAAAVLFLVAGILTSLLYAGEARQQAATAEREARRADDEAAAAARLAQAETAAKLEAQRLAAAEAEARQAAERLREDAQARERELRVRGLIQDLAAFDAAGQSLDHALRQTEPSHVWWPRWARLLLHGQEEDLERGLPWRPGLADVEAQLAALRSQALERTAEEIEADRAAFPQAEELAAKQAELTWHRRMLGEEPWPSEEEVEAALASDSLPSSATELTDLAWKLVDPDAPVFGEEVRGLLLARRAVEAAEADWSTASVRPPTTEAGPSQPGLDEDVPVLRATGSKDRAYSAWQAVGPPDADPLDDDGHAWSYADPYATETEWLELGYHPPLRCARIRIYEAQAAGEVFRITAMDVEGGELTLWEGDSSTTHPVIFEIEPTERPIVSLKLYIDPTRSHTWLEIDAVGVSGPDGSAWAATARASNEYGAGVDGEEPAGRSLDPEVAARQLAHALNALAWALLRTGEIEQGLKVGHRMSGDAPLEAATEAEARSRRLEASVVTWKGTSARDRIHTLVSELAVLGQERDERRSWHFVESDLEWWHGQLSALVEDLHRIEERLAFVVRSVKTPEAVARWEEAIAAIESQRGYGGLKLTPQIGLRPIGPDPESGLWEFAHLQTGEPPERGKDGKLVLTEETGLVFVLLPGDRFWMGAQKTDPDGRNYDRLADDDESPVHEVELSPFFLSKYEMAQGPWRRVARWTPPNWGRDLLQPASFVSWDDCIVALGRADAWITLPTEAQWEYACRAGTGTPWWTGPDVESLRGMENVNWDNTEFQALPIGQLAANRFGLHDMHGNLCNWCLDGWGHSDGIELRVNPVHPCEGADERVYRSGINWRGPAFARSSSRDAWDRGVRLEAVGLRPAKRIEP